MKLVVLAWIRRFHGQLVQDHCSGCTTSQAVVDSRIFFGGTLSWPKIRFGQKADFN
jgi:hypothetical protein